MVLSARRTKLSWQTITKLLGLVVLIIAANSLAGWVMEAVEFEYRPANEEFVHKIILLSAITYALFIVINLPGNIFVGGGGGIAMIAGASRLYTLPGFLVTIVLAVAPVPLAILIFGTEFLSG